MSQLGVPVGSSGSQLSLLGPRAPAGELAGAGLSLAVLGSGRCKVGPRPALGFSEHGGVPHASGSQLSVHAPVFSPQEGVADAAAVPPVWRRRGLEGEYSDELRLAILRESQRRIEQEQARASVQVEPFLPTLGRGSGPDSSGDVS